MPKVLRAILVVSLFGALAAALALAAFVAAQARRESLGVEAPASGALVDIGEGAIFVRRFGASRGPAVVVVPGTAAWSGFWTSTAEAIADAGFAVVALDLPPFGFSYRPASGDYSRAAQAERLAALIRKLKLEKPIVLAHSFGAGAEVELALRHRDELGGLVLVDGALALPPEGGEPPPESAWLRAALAQPWIARAAVDAVLVNPLATRRLLAGLLANPERATPAAAEALQRPYRRAGTSEAYARWLPFLVFADHEARSADPANYSALGRLPVALIWGEQDRVTPLAQGERLRRLIPGATLDALPGLGHIPHLEDERAFVDATTRRLREMNRL